MSIAIIGAGGIGSVVAAYLHKAAHEVALIGRVNQVEAINAHGLKITGVRGEETFSVKACTRLDKPYDLVIFTVKTQDLEEAYQDNLDFLEDEKTVILTSQNGVQSDNILSVHFQKEQMVSSIVMFGATYIQPGEVIFNFEGDWILGRPFLPVGSTVHQVAEILSQAFETTVSANITGMKWLKLFVNFNNCIPAVIGKPMQEAFADMDLCRLSVMLMREGVDIVKKLNIQLVSLPSFPVDRIYGLAAMPLDQAAGIINQTLTKLSDKPVYGSILQSIMRQRPTEIDFINGEVVHLAKQVQMRAPLNEKIVEMVHTVERTGEFFSVDVVKDKFNL